MQSIYEIAPKDFLISNSFEEHPYVIKFNETDLNDDSYKNVMIKAYIVRDIMYNGNKTLGQIIEGHCKKLGFNPNEEDILSRRKYKFMNEIKEMVTKQEFTEETIKDYYFKIINENESKEETLNREKYHNIMNLVHNDESIENIYNQFSIDELTIIGW